jgi:hypothetical protein
MQMNRMKTISAAIILSASVAAPAFAQEAGYGAPAPYQRGVAPQTYYRSYGQVPGSYMPPRDNQEYWNLQNFGTTGRDPSRVGGESPSLNPPS